MAAKEKSVCIIPARGGSKRVPRKNVLPFLGKPIILYTIEAALRSGIFEQVIVSTEDAEIIRVAQATPARVMPRPQSLATDAATVVEVCLHVLDTLSGEGFRPEFLCCLYATAPMRTEEDIKATFNAMISKNAAAAMAVTSYHIPPWWAMKADERGFLGFAWPELVEMRKEEVPAMVVDNGSTYWVRVETLRKEKTFIPSQVVGYAMPFHRSIDIDTPYDLELAKCLAALGAKRDE